MLTTVDRVPEVRTPDTVASVVNAPDVPVGRARIRADPFEVHVVGLVHVKVARSGDDSATDEAVHAVPTAPADDAATTATASAVAMARGPRKTGGDGHRGIPGGRELLTKYS